MKFLTKTLATCLVALPAVAGEQADGLIVTLCGEPLGVSVVRDHHWLHVDIDTLLHSEEAQNAVRGVPLERVNIEIPECASRRKS